MIRVKGTQLPERTGHALQVSTFEFWYGANRARVVYKAFIKVQSTLHLRLAMSEIYAEI